MQTAHETMVRKTVEIDTDLAKSIQELADDKKWSFSYMSYVLLQQSVKERSRKRKAGTKKDNTP